MTLPPLALYIHIPWCVRKCPYCDFNSHKAGNQIPEAEYVSALDADMRSDVDASAGRPLQSIFFGGGTPSLFSAQAIGQILDSAERHFGFADDIEITLEANPGTAEQQRFRDYRLAGVNRLSIGVQSFQTAQLQHLGRIHSGSEAMLAADMARQAGIDNFNLDLMHGLPGQTTDAACADLRQALALGPTHLSWYQLTIEPNTEFYRRPPTLPIEDTLADIQDQGLLLLREAGFDQYEVSAYAQSGKQARHNLNYWQFGDYIGAGAGAHGKLSRVDGEQLKIERRWKTRAPEHYLARADDYVAGRQLLAAEDLPLEFMMNALRLNQGVNNELYQQRTGQTLLSLRPILAQLEADGLLLHDRLQTTDLGRRFLNRLLLAFEAPAIAAL